MTLLTWLLVLSRFQLLLMLHHGPQMKGVVITLKKYEEKISNIIKIYNYNYPKIIAKTNILCDYHEPALSIING